jgi:hypothetical protein
LQTTITFVRSVTAASIASGSAAPPAESTATGRAPARAAISGNSGYEGQ